MGNSVKKLFLKDKYNQHANLDKVEPKAKFL